MRFRFTLLFLAFAAAAQAQPAAPDFATWVAKANNGDADTDFTALRQAYARSDGYDPYGRRWREPFDAAWKAFQAKDCMTALAKTEEALAVDYTIMSLHVVRSECFKQAGDETRAAREMAIGRGLSQSVLRSGDGNSPQTAYAVVTMSEERMVMTARGLQVTGQALLNTQAGMVDALTARDPKTGQSVSVYFNVTPILLGAARMLQPGGNRPSPEDRPAPPFGG